MKNLLNKYKSFAKVESVQYQSKILRQKVKKIETKSQKKIETYKKKI